MFRPYNFPKLGEIFIGNSKGVSKIHDSVHEGTHTKKILVKRELGKKQCIFSSRLYFFSLLKPWKKIISVGHLVRNCQPKEIISGNTAVSVNRILQWKTLLVTLTIIGCYIRSIFIEVLQHNPNKVQYDKMINSS